MTELEAQAEELEALISIYDGDVCFKQVSNITFQYKVNIKRNSKNIANNYKINI